MARRVWSVHLEDGAHIVELEHGWLSGKRTVRLDGQPVIRESQVLDTGSHPFMIGPHEAIVTISTNGLMFRYGLLIDGHSQETGEVRSPAGVRQVAESQRQASQGLAQWFWSWLFYAICAIPVGLLMRRAMTGEVVSPAATDWKLAAALAALVGAWLCTRIVRTTTDGTGVRVIKSACVVVGSWLLAVLLYVRSLAPAPPLA